MIFNSLGSNYNLRFALKALGGTNRPQKQLELKSYLEQKYRGKAVLLYKAREAITLALRSLDLPKNSAVAINGYTCYAVYKAVTDAGCRPEYLDIVDGGLNFSAQALKTALMRNPDIKAVIIQNTLGFICDMENISAICKERSLILIEDLAHSAGAVYSNGQQAGTVGDFTVLSFSQDKIIDAVSGGALIARNNKYQNFNTADVRPVGRKQQIIDRMYPLATYKIRKTYALGIGRAAHFFYKKSGLLPKPMGNLDKIILHNLPNWYCGLAYFQFREHEKNLRHRKQAALVYAQNLNPKVLLPGLTGQIPQSANLRFPILVKDREKLVEYLKGYGIHISDIWYDAPVAPPKYLPMTDYKNQCPGAEKVSAEMLNLPTHLNTSLSDAGNIAEKINQWLKLQ
jgi:dTDP-4-amino-4,6-dideoxygalactose transaminase